MQLRPLNKKGDVSDVFVVMVIMSFLAISFIVTLFVNDKLSEIISTTELSNSSAGPQILSAFDNVNSNAVQRGYALMMGLLIIGTMVSAFLIRVHPAFMFLYIIVLAVTMFTAVFMGNTYSVIISNPSLAATANDQGMINFFMLNIVKITLAIGALSMLIAFSKIFIAPAGRSDVI